MEKLDFKVADRPFYTGKAAVWTLVDVPEWPFVGIDGAGDPNTSPAYAAAVGALYALSYGLKARGKAVHGRDHVVGPLEGLWWAEDMAAFRRRDKKAWHWRMLIRQPDWLDAGDLEAVRPAVLKKTGKGASAQAVAAATWLRLTEGRSAQALHVGSYDVEAPLLERLHDEFLPAAGLRPSGLHHEIYLSDPRKVDAARLKTILRQPVEKAV